VKSFEEVLRQASGEKCQTSRSITTTKVTSVKAVVPVLPKDAPGKKKGYKPGREPFATLPASGPTGKITVPTKLLGTPPYFQCILMALRVLEKCNNS
jgi:hypothetical protein